MTTLTEREVRLAEQLLLCVKNGESYITYGNIAVRTTPKMNARGMGDPLESICILCYELGLPLLTAIVVQKATGLSGDGFGLMLKRLGRYVDPDKSALLLFHDELHAIHNCTEWDKPSTHLHLNISFK